MITSTILLLFFSFSIFLVILGFWRKDFVAIGVSACCFIFVGFIFLTSGIDLPGGELIEINRTEINNYDVIAFTYNETVQDRTVVANITILETTTTTPSLTNYKTGLVNTFGILILLFALYLLFLAYDILISRGNDGGRTE